jgi:tRNA(Ile)-lysidine synthase
MSLGSARDTTAAEPTSPNTKVTRLTPLHHAIRRTIERDNLCPPGTRLLVAVSGGSDSVALLWVMLALAKQGILEVAGIAHFNHQLRDTAARDESFCCALATRAKCLFVSGTSDVRARAHRDRLSIEDAARRERYAFLREVAARVHATHIATGHTKDDQAETFLLKLVRGAGLAGLGGIYPVRDAIVRPLLHCSRAELRAYLEARGETWMEDETNADVTNPRNRVRHIVLPQLEQAFGPSVRDALARAADLAGQDGAWLDVQAAEALTSLAEELPDGMAFRSAALQGLPAPIARRILLAAMRGTSNGREVSLHHVQAALDVLAGRCRAAQTPAGAWELLGGLLVLYTKGPSTDIKRRGPTPRVRSRR